MKRKVPGRSSLSLVIASTIASASALPGAQAAEFVSDPPHVFSIDDIQGDFNGSTYGSAGAVTDNTIICDVPGGVACPDTAEVRPVIDKQGVTLYPIDSEFGFYIVDFLGAAQKFRDDNYAVRRPLDHQQPERPAKAGGHRERSGQPDRAEKVPFYGVGSLYPPLFNMRIDNNILQGGNSLALFYNAIGSRGSLLVVFYYLESVRMNTGI